MMIYMICSFSKLGFFLIYMFQIPYTDTLKNKFLLPSAIVSSTHKLELVFLTWSVNIHLEALSVVDCPRYQHLYAKDIT